MYSVQGVMKAIFSLFRRYCFENMLANARVTQSMSPLGWGSTEVSCPGCTGTQLSPTLQKEYKDTTQILNDMIITVLIDFI